MDLSAKYSAMATFKRAIIGGRMANVALTEYDESNDTYWGTAFFTRTLEVGEESPRQEAVIGLRRYPYPEEPNYPFQFVDCGDMVGEDRLRRIAQENWDAGQAPTEAPVVLDEASTSVDNLFDPDDLNKDGVVTKKERKRKG